ncbi:hypothetical protein Taro_022229 [Colocasia esculenta]|uniref:Uncharacterized protein n=1 Tax=Colocasia esculenta TaxID=4460 RepID=A0A843V132_COLES|nr:hypothetical protein [Colocasia esculenta]
MGAAAGREPVDEGIPGGHVPYVHFVEHLLRGVQIPALGISVDDGSLQAEVGGQPAADDTGMELRGLPEGIGTGTSPEGEGAGERVRAGPSAEAYHVGEDGYGGYGVLTLCKTANGGVPVVGGRAACLGEHCEGVTEVAEGGDGAEVHELGTGEGARLEEARGEEVGVELLDVGEGGAPLQRGVKLRHGRRRWRATPARRQTKASSSQPAEPLSDLAFPRTKITKWKWRGKGEKVGALDRGRPENEKSTGHTSTCSDAGVDLAEVRRAPRRKSTTTLRFLPVIWSSFRGCLNLRLQDFDSYYMEECYGSDAGMGGGDSSNSIDASSANHNRRRLLPQQFSANAYLGHAFNACASSSPGSSGSAYVDVDPSLLRYTRPRPSFSSSSSDERFWQFQRMQSPMGSSSSSSPSPMGRVRTPTRRPPTVYCSPARGTVMDDVLVINDELHKHNRVASASARRRLDLGSHSASSAYGGSIKFWSSNIRSGRGSGVFHPRHPDLGSYSPAFAGSSGTSSHSSNIRSGGGSGIFHQQMERRRSLGEFRYAVEPSQVGLQTVASDRNQGNRSYTLPSSSTATDVPPVEPSTIHPATSAAVCDDGFSFELGGDVNRHISVLIAPQEAEAGPAPGWTAAKGSTGGTGGMLPEPAAVPNVWRRTEEEEEKLFKILNGPIPPPPPPSASTFSWLPTEEEEAEIQQVLHGPGSGRRLPAFQQFCSED